MRYWRTVSRAVPVSRSTGSSRCTTIRRSIPTRMAPSADGSSRAAGLRSSLELPYPAEFFWLLGLVFFLPLFEAPKNICLAAYLLTWLYNRARARDWGGPWDRWDGLIGVWIVSAYVVAAFAGVHHEEWKEANDVLR